MFKILKGIFGGKKRINLPAGKRNLFRGMAIRPNGWTRDSHALWIKRVTVAEYRSGFEI